MSLELRKIIIRNIYWEITLLKLLPPNPPGANDFKAKLKPFSRRHFQLHFLYWKLSYKQYIFTEICLEIWQNIQLCFSLVWFFDVIRQQAITLIHPRPVRRQAITSTNALLLSIRPLATNFSDIWIEIQNFSFMKMHLKMSFAKCQPFCPGGDELTNAYRDPRLRTASLGYNEIFPFIISYVKWGMRKLGLETTGCCWWRCWRGWKW